MVMSPDPPNVIEHHAELNAHVPPFDQCERYNQSD